MGREFDAVIIGAGAAGYSAGVHIARLGGKVALVERENVGGLCVHFGCIPTKVLVAMGRTMLEIKQAQRRGVISKLVSYSPSEADAWRERVVRRFAKAVEANLRKEGVEVIKGLAFIDTPHRVIVEEEGGGKRVLEGRNVVIASGSSAIRPSSIAQDGEVSTSKEVFEWRKVPQSLAVIGGGYIGAEFACVFNALGAEVYLIEKLERILATEEEEVSREIEGIMSKRGVHIFTETTLTKMEKKEGKVYLRILEKGKVREIEVERVLLAVGRQARFDAHSLERIGVEFDEKGIKTDLRMRTNIEGIYAIGDVTGRFMLANVACKEGIVAAENIMGKEREIDYSNIPNCIFTIPEIASVGKREGRSGKAFFSANAKANAQGETEGWVKVYVHNQRFVGASVIGPEASSLIVILQLFLGERIERIREAIIPHPSFPEVIWEAIAQVDK